MRGTPFAGTLAKFSAGMRRVIRTGSEKVVPAGSRPYRTTPGFCAAPARTGGYSSGGSTRMVMLEVSARASNGTLSVTSPSSLVTVVSDGAVVEVVVA